MATRKIKTYYHDPFAKWVRGQMNHNRTKDLQEKFGVSLSLLYKWSNGSVRPSFKYFGLYDEALKQMAMEKIEQVEVR